MVREAERRCRDLALRNHGVITLTQALANGVSHRTVRARTSDGHWQLIHPNVFSPGASPLSWKGQLVAACEWAKDGIASHRSAAALWRLPRGLTDPPEITVVRCKLAPRAGIRMHFTDKLPPHHVTKIDGIRVTSVERTLLDLCAVLPEEAGAMALDDALRRGLTELRAVDRLIGEVARRGRRGCGRLRRLVREREGLPATPHSPLETSFFQLLRRSPLPMPECQYVIRAGPRFVARVDFAYPAAKLAIECHSARWHSDKAARANDLRRLGELVDLGWTVRFITHQEIVWNPSGTIADLQRLYESRAA